MSVDLDPRTVTALALRMVGGKWPTSASATASFLDVYRFSPSGQREHGSSGGLLVPGFFDDVPGSYWLSQSGELSVQLTVVDTAPRDETVLQVARTAAVAELNERLSGSTATPADDGSTAVSWLLSEVTLDVTEFSADPGFGTVMLSIEPNPPADAPE